MSIDYAPTARALGLDVPNVAVRVVAVGKSFVRGEVAMLDTPLSASSDFASGLRTSGLANAVPVTSDAAKTARIIGVFEEDTPENAVGEFVVRGTPMAWVNGDFGSGTPLSVGQVDNGIRILGCTLERSVIGKMQSLVKCLWDGISGIGTVLLENPADPPPVVQITSPGNDSVFEVGTNVVFVGTANDVPDGDISANITWFSDLNFLLGVGASISTNALRVGDHIITAVVQDSANQFGYDTIHITIYDPNEGDGGGGDGGGGGDKNPSEGGALNKVVINFW